MFEVVVLVDGARSEAWIDMLVPIVITDTVNLWLRKTLQTGAVDKLWVHDKRCYTQCHTK